MTEIFNYVMSNFFKLPQDFVSILIIFFPEWYS